VQQPEFEQYGSPAIAITGVGLVTALGVTAEQTWQAVLAGSSCAGPMPGIESTLPDGADGYQAAELPADYQTDLPRETRYLRWSIESALRDAGLLEARQRQHVAPARRAVALGTTLHGMRAAGRFYRNENTDELRSFLAGDVLFRAIEGFDFAGPATTSCSACSSGLGSIATGATLLATGAADLVIAGGYDPVSEYVWAGFNALRLVADGPLRPFTRDRRGMKLGEGYAIVILERLEDARRRGVPQVHAVVAGFAESADAHHLTQSHPQGAGAAAAMRLAMQRAAVEPASIGLIAAHATGTPDNDAAEHSALVTVMGERLARTPIVAFKTHVGHTLGAAGAAELILSAMALRDRTVPQTLNVEPSQLEFDELQLSQTRRPSVALKHTMNLSLGFGGANACVILSPPPVQTSVNENVAAATRQQDDHNHGREVWITGIGAVLPGAIDRAALLKKLDDDGVAAWQAPPPPLADEEIEQLLTARRTRRMSRYTKLVLAAAQQARGDAGMTDKEPALLAGAGAIIGTTHGSVSFCNDYYRQIVRDGVSAANPVLFAEGVPNVGSAQLSLMLGLTGPCQSIIGTRTAGLDALRLAWLRIAAGQADRLIVGAADEGSALIEAIYTRCGLCGGSGTLGAPYHSTAGFRFGGGGAIAFVLESGDAARARGASGYARIEHAAASCGAPQELPRTLASVLRAASQTPHWIGSGNGTWIDALELNALKRANPNLGGVGGVYRHFGESFSVTSLAGAASVLLRRRLPVSEQITVCERVDQFGVVCTDWQGGVSSAIIRSLDRN
jgi:3-oxoacyl-[acyl-carrier-protein] synthase II